MKRSTWLIMLTTAVMLAFLSISGFYLRYVKGQMLVGLLLTAALLGLLAVRAVRRGDDEKPPRAALLMFVPLAVFLLFPSQNAGPFTDNTPRLIAANAVGAPLPQVSNGVIDIPMYVYASHASYGDPLLQNKTFAMEGFVYTQGDRHQLVRLISSCCAADAQALVLDLDSDPGPVDYTWVRIEGTYLASDQTHEGVGVPKLAVTSVTPIDAPADPFE